MCVQYPFFWGDDFAACRLFNEGLRLLYSILQSNVVKEFLKYIIGAMAEVFVPYQQHIIRVGISYVPHPAACYDPKPRIGLHVFPVYIEGIVRNVRSKLFQ